jgi:NADP-dependent 3-hydroxy acid dehydrogenase YdfG
MLDSAKPLALVTGASSGIGQSRSSTLSLSRCAPN